MGQTVGTQNAANAPQDRRKRENTPPTVDESTIINSRQLGSHGTHLLASVNTANTNHPELGMRISITAKESPTSPEFTVEYGAGVSCDMLSAMVPLHDRVWYSTLTTVTITVRQKHYTRAQFWVNIATPPDGTIQKYAAQSYSDNNRCILYVPTNNDPLLWVQALGNINNDLKIIPVPVKSEDGVHWSPLALAVSDMFKMVSKLADARANVAEIRLWAQITTPGKEEPVVVMTAYEPRNRRLTVRRLGTAITIPYDEDPVTYLVGIDWAADKLPEHCQITCGQAWSLPKQEGTIANIVLLKQRINQYLMGLPRRHHASLKYAEPVPSQAFVGGTHGEMREKPTKHSLVMGSLPKPSRSKALPQPMESSSLKTFSAESQNMNEDGVRSAEQRQPHEPRSKRSKTSRRRCRRCNK